MTALQRLSVGMTRPVAFWVRASIVQPCTHPVEFLGMVSNPHVLESHWIRCHQCGKRGPKAGTPWRAQRAYERRGFAFRGNPNGEPFISPLRGVPRAPRQQT